MTEFGRLRERVTEVYRVPPHSLANTEIHNERWVNDTTSKAPALNGRGYTLGSGRIW